MRYIIQARREYTKNELEIDFIHEPDQWRIDAGECARKDVMFTLSVTESAFRNYGVGEIVEFALSVSRIKEAV